MRMTAVRAFTLPQNLAGSQVDAQIGPVTTALVMTISVNGVSEGVFSFNGGPGSPVTSISDLMSNADTITGNLASGDVSIVAGDIVELTLTTVSSADNISVTFKTAAS